MKLARRFGQSIQRSLQLASKQLLAYTLNPLFLISCIGYRIRFCLICSAIKENLRIILSQVHNRPPSITCRILLRILPPEVKASIQHGNKFGAALSEISILAERCKELNLQVEGITFHVGSPCQDVRGHAKAVDQARKAFDILEQAGFSPHVLNVGGGFPGFYFGTPEEVKFEEVF